MAKNTKNRIKPSSKNAKCKCNNTNNKAERDFSLDKWKALVLVFIAEKILSTIFGSIWTQLTVWLKALFTGFLTYCFIPLIISAADNHGWFYVGLTTITALLPYLIARAFVKSIKSQETINILYMFGIVWCVWWTIVFNLNPLFSILSTIWMLMGCSMESMRSIFEKKYQDFLDKNFSK